MWKNWTLVLLYFNLGQEIVQKIPEKDIRAVDKDIIVTERNYFLNFS